MINATLGASGLWLGTRTGAGGSATLTESFFGRSPWLHGQQVKNINIRLELGVDEVKNYIQKIHIKMVWTCDADERIKNN